MFKLIIASKRIEAKKNNIIQISSEFTRYILLVDNLVEFDITHQISPLIEINFKSDEAATFNIIFKSGESLYNVPVEYRVNN